VTLYAPLLLPVVLAMSAFWVLLAVTVVLIRGRFRKGIIVPLEEFAHEIHALERGVSSNSTRPRSREGFTELRDLSRAFTEMAATIRSREKALTQAADEKESMLKEIHHRLKNNLNVAASLLSLQADEIDSLDGARKALIDSRARIYSMAQVHEELYKSENLSAVDMQSYVDGVTSELATVYGGENAVELSTRVDDVTLDIQYAIPCGIILNELISNAYEHAFPDGRDGHIEVRLESPAANRYRLMVRDDGVGTPPEVGPSTTSSLGIQLVYTLAEQIGAVVTLGRERGTSFELRWSDDAENRPERAH
jgi:two-component sensor histidine kinase